MRLPTTLAVFVLVNAAVWAGEVDTSMTYVAKLPGPARQLVEGTDGRIFVVLHEPKAGLGLVLEDGDGVQMVYEGTVASAAASLDGFLYLVEGEEDRRVLRLSAVEAEPATDGLKVTNIEVTAAFGGAPTGHGNVVRSTDGAIRIEGCPNLRRADGTFETVPNAGGKNLFVPLTRDLFGNYWSLTSTGDTRVLVLAADDPTYWQDVTPSEGGSWKFILADAVGFVWIAGPYGLRRIDPSTDEGWLELPPTLSLPTGEVSALARSPNGRALVCFASGEVIEIDYNSNSGRAEVAHLTRELLPALVQAVLTDSRGNVWLSIGNELYRREGDERAWQHHWKALSPMPGGNHDIFSVEVAGRLYTAGGVTSGWGYPAEHHWFDELWAYDGATKAWEVAGRLQADLCYNGIATLEQEVWIVGGADNVDEVRVPTAAVQIFDPRTSAWRQGPELNEARMEPVVVTAGDRIYAIGGASDNSSPMASVESIGPKENSWRMENSLPAPMRQFAGATLNGIIYCISKEAGFSYDVQTGIWQELPRLGNMPQAAQVAAHNGEIWVMGGVRIKRSFRYDPAQGEWLPGPNLPTEQSWGSASDLNGRLVLAGGARWSEFHQRYIFDDSAYMYREGSFEE